MKLMVAAHCHLNPGVRIRDFPGKKLDIQGNVIQLPCPESIYLGPLRWEVSREQLDFPMYRRFCRELFSPIADIIADALKEHPDCEITFIGVPKSPSCASQTTTVGYTGGRIKETEHQHISGKGIFFEEIEKELKRRGIKAEYEDASILRD